MPKPKTKNTSRARVKEEQDERPPRKMLKKSSTERSQVGKLSRNNLKNLNREFDSEDKIKPVKRRSLSPSSLNLTQVFLHSENKHHPLQAAAGRASAKRDLSPTPASTTHNSRDAPKPP